MQPFDPGPAPHPADLHGLGALDLARAAVALPGWRWMPGMRWYTEPSGAPDDGGDCGRLDNYSPEYMGRPKGALPDLRDPATAGCLLALLGMAASRVSLADGTDLACLSDHPVSAGPPPPMTLGEVCVAVALRCGRWPGWGDR